MKFLVYDKIKNRFLSNKQVKVKWQNLVSIGIVTINVTIYVYQT